MRKNRMFAAITSFTLLYVSAFAMPAGAEEGPPGTVDATGVVGRGLRAKYDSETATLTIIKGSNEGTGEINPMMYNFGFSLCAVQTIVMESGVTKVGNRSFESCGSLEHVEFADTVRTIGEGAFEGCVSLSDFVLPDSLNTIGYHAFKDCVSLEEITLPYNMRHTGSEMFTGCTSLRSLTILNPDCPIYNEPSLTDCVVRGYNSSTAQSFAEKNGLAFESLGDIPEPYPTLGDYDGDGLVDPADAQLILTGYANMLVGVITAADFRAGDVDGSGVITPEDAQYITRYYMQKDVLGYPTEWRDIIE